jgi:hypothetical protein
VSERIVEAALFALPFLVFAAWRFLPASVLPPASVAWAGSLVAVALLATLLWLHHSDARNAGHRYVPAEIRDGRLVPAHADP